MPVVLTGAGEPVRLEAVRVTPELLPLLGTRAYRGRLFDADDAATTAVLSHGVWRTRFGGADVIDRTFVLDGVPHTVIGVLPAEWTPPEALSLDDVAVYVPLDLRATAYRARSIFVLSVVARLEPETTLETARAELAGLASRLAESYPGDWRSRDGEPSEIVAQSLEVLPDAGASGRVWKSSPCHGDAVPDREIHPTSARGRRFDASAGLWPGNVPLGFRHRRDVMD